MSPDTNVDQSGDQKAISTLRHVGTVVAGGTAIVAPAALLAAPASAIPVSSCGGYPGAVEVIDGVCEYIFDEADTYTFTAPEDVTKVSAILIGGGGGGFADSSTAYGGGGGEVIYVDDISGETQVVVGAGGAAGDGQVGATDGTATTVGKNIAQGGGGAPENGSGGTSGSGKAGVLAFNFYTGLLGGAGGGSSDVGNGVEGGPGLAASAASGVDTDLFPVSVNETKFGPGGSLVDSGGNYFEVPQGEDVSFEPAGLAPDVVAGAGGNVVIDINTDPVSMTANGGEDGAVVIRWAAPAGEEDGNTLPETGASVSPWAMAVSFAAIGSGMVAVLRRRRLTNN